MWSINDNKMIFEAYFPNRITIDKFLTVYRDVVAEYKQHKHTVRDEEIARYKAREQLCPLYKFYAFIRDSDIYTSFLEEHVDDLLIRQYHFIKLDSETAFCESEPGKEFIYVFTDVRAYYKHIVNRIKRCKYKEHILQELNNCIYNLDCNVQEIPIDAVI